MSIKRDSVRSWPAQIRSVFTSGMVHPPRSLAVLPLGVTTQSAFFLLSISERSDFIRRNTRMAGIQRKCEQDHLSESSLGSRREHLTPIRVYPDKPEAVPQTTEDARLLIGESIGVFTRKDFPHAKPDENHTDCCRSHAAGLPILSGTNSHTIKAISWRILRDALHFVEIGSCCTGAER